MNLIEIIKTRRSIMPNQYNNTPIKENDIIKILDAANWAPTHKRTEPWRFKVLSGSKKEELGIFLANKFKSTAAVFSEFKFEKIKINTNKADVVIAICMQKDVKQLVPEWEEVAAVAMAVQNMWLMATELNIGAYWSSPNLISYADEFFDLKENEVCLGFFYMGHYDLPTPERQPGDINEKITWLK
ncbi:nitroreductase [Flavobacterium sp. 14A]|uniref:nitroreductase family protein n=1 Tax=Flavobacterium sp. 14A TaxID=2735896 RepID=UPI0015703CEB|nr:nitroreductase [Flavobacterium sp. 14A]NRT13514.1 nitroreductase [Flavobacterium sp. 14A]